jgi:hypothetical protein
MTIFKFKLTAMPLRHCKNGNSRIVTNSYPGYYIFLDKSVVKYLTDCQRLIFLNNNMFLIIETENDKHWRISTEIEGHLSSIGVRGKIKTIMQEEEIGILCTEFDIPISNHL